MKLNVQLTENDIFDAQVNKPSLVILSGPVYFFRQLVRNGLSQQSFNKLFVGCATNNGQLTELEKNVFLLTTANMSHTNLCNFILPNKL